MNWFSGFLRRRRMQKIRRTLGSRARYADVLSTNLEFSHLSSIARLARRVAGTQTPLWALDVALPELVTNADLTRTLERSDLGRLNSELNRLVFERAKRIAESAAPGFARLAPPGCQIITDAVQRLAVQILRDGVRESDIGQRLSSGVLSSPQTYFDGYAIWVDDRASENLESLRPQLRALAPPELELDDAKCLDRLRHELGGKISPAGMGERFAAHYKANLATYVRGYDDWLKSQAEAVFEEVHQALVQTMPTKSALKKELCIAELVGLFRRHLARQQIVDSIVKTVRNNPTRFFQGYLETFIPAATKMFYELNEQLSSTLGVASLRLIKESSVRALATLLASGMAPDGVIESFVKQVASAPKQFIAGWQDPYEVRSSSPYRSSTAGARLAR